MTSFPTLKDICGHVRLYVHPRTHTHTLTPSFNLICSPPTVNAWNCVRASTAKIVSPHLMSQLKAANSLFD